MTQKRAVRTPRISLTVPGKGSVKLSSAKLYQKSNKTKSLLRLNRMGDAEFVPKRYGIKYIFAFLVWRWAN